MTKPKSSSSYPSNALPLILKKSQYTEIWGVDLKNAPKHQLGVIFTKFLKRHGAIPSLQASRENASLDRTLKWRRLYRPKTLIREAESLLSKLDSCHITLNKGQYILWVKVDEMMIHGCSSVHPNLGTFNGLLKLGIAVMEKLSILVMKTARDSNNQNHSASCVIEFQVVEIQNQRTRQIFREKLRYVLEVLAGFIQNHYPDILEKAYIIDPSDDYLSHLDIDESLLKQTVLLSDPEKLSQFLGSNIPSEYGGTEESFWVSDLLYEDCSKKNPEEETTLKEPEQGKDPEDQAAPKSRMNEDSFYSEVLGAGSEATLTYSKTIGPPSVMLSLDHLETPAIGPSKKGVRVAMVDEATVVKFGPKIGLAEAEALNLISTQTTIATPKLVSAHMLGDIGYILMSYEKGTPFEEYWDYASEEEQDRILEQLRDYVRQMQKIEGDFIGGVDKSSCRGSIFDIDGDHTKKSHFGPFKTEKIFNEGIIEVLRSRVPSILSERENDMESHLFNAEHMLYKTIRSLKNHSIVFAHGNLRPENMIVRDDGTIVLVGWGSAGFWPEYWEFCCALSKPSWRASWDRMVERFIPPFYAEYAVLKNLSESPWR